MPDDALLYAFLIRLAILGAAVVNAVLAFTQYREFRDSRGLRGFVAALTMLSGASAIGSGSHTIATAFPTLADLFDFATTAGVTGFVLGVLFSVSTWTLDRREAHRRRAMVADQAHANGQRSR